MDTEIYIYLYVAFVYFISLIDKFKLNDVLAALILSIFWFIAIPTRILRKLLR